MNQHCMMMLSEIAQAVDGQLLGADTQVMSVGIDSRNIIKNQLFVAIAGENFDGNTFALDAIKQGAAAALVSDSLSLASPAILVKDTRMALGKLAYYWRQKFTLPLIAITGSNGKTTVKEMLAAILGAANKNVLATVGNLNNAIGMPLTLLNIRPEHDMAVIEMGMNHLGEIDYLTHIAQPNIAVINNAGSAHIGELGSRENIAIAKGEIFTGLMDDGIAVLNADDHFADYWRGLNKNRNILSFGIHKKADISASVEANMHEAYSAIVLTTPQGQINIHMPVLGEHNVHNALAASACAVALGVTNADIARGLSNFTGVKGRLQRKAGFNNAALIDDTYNANPDSMKAAIDVLAIQKSDTIFVMGDMGELGSDAARMHADIGLYAKQKSIHQLLTFGEFSQFASVAFGNNAQHFNVLEEMVAHLKSIMQANVTVLVKGSRFMQMERVVHLIEQKNQVKPSDNKNEENSLCC